MEDGYRRQGTGGDISGGLGVAPNEGVDAGPRDRRSLVSRGLGVAPGGVDTGPYDGADIFNSSCSRRMAGRESVGSERPAAAANRLGAAWHNLAQPGTTWPARPGLAWPDPGPGRRVESKKYGSGRTQQPRGTARVPPGYRLGEQIRRDG